MPWVRLDENAMDHPKFLALTDGAWRLWCEGQTYCQKHLTDGVIPASALRGFRYYSPARVKNLTAILVPGKGPCWHLDDHGSYLVHDFADWNDSRDEVLKARKDGKERRARWKAKNASGNASPDVNETANVSCGVVCSSYLQESKNGKIISTPEGIAAFDRFWAVYPRHEGRQQAQDEWRTSGIDAALEAVILADIAKRVGLGWATEPRFVPYASRYLAERMWQERFTPRLAPKPARAESDGRVVPGAEETRRKLAELRTQN